MKTISTLKTDNLSLVLFSIPIYDSKICFIKYNENGFDEAIEWLDELGLKTDDYKTDEFRYCYGFTFKERIKLGYVHFLFMNNSNEYKDDYINTLSHETFHLIEHICKHHGLEHYETGDNEHKAYLTGYLFDILSKL